MAAVWILFFYFLQNALVSIFPLIPFPFMIAAVIYFALTKGPAFGALVGFFAGLLLETFATSRFGVQLGLWTAAGFFSGLLSSRVFPESFLVQLLLPPIVQVAMSTAEYFLRASGTAGSESSFPRGFFWLSVLMVWIAAPTVFRLLYRPVRR